MLLGLCLGHLLDVSKVVLHAREDSSKGSGKSLNLGLAEVVDDGWDIKIRIGSAKISVPKTEVVGYAAPVVGLAVVGIIGALLLGDVLQHCLSPGCL